MLLLARLVRLVTAVVVAIIVAGILLNVLEANLSNSIVSAVNDAAKFLVGPFDNVFSLDDSKANIAVNWGLAAAVYAIVGGIISRLLARAGIATHDARERRGWGWRRGRRRPEAY